MIIDGKQIASHLRQTIKTDVAKFIDKHGVIPKLTVVLVGDDPASQVYVRNKIKQTKEVGMISNEIRFSKDISEQQLLDQLTELNADTSTHGILVQLPLPKHINEQLVINTIAPEKDVDGFHPINSGGLLNGNKNVLVPCTPKGCVKLAKSFLGTDLTGQHVVIVGRSNIVGKPLSLLFLQENCTVTICHSKTQNIENLCQQADILVAAVGVANLVKRDWVKPNAVVIDVGINRIESSDGKSKLVGDVDFSAIETKAAAITPVPGGVGPMTIACLLENTLLAAQQQSK